MEPFIFRRSKASKVLAVVASIVVVPVMTAVITVVLTVATMAILTSVHVPQQAAGVVLLVYVPLVGTALTVSAVRRYRRHSRLAVTICDQQLQVQTPGQCQVVAFEDVVDVRLVPRRLDAVCVLELRNGARLALPYEVAAFSTVRGAMEATLVGQLAEQLGQRIGAGRPIRVRESAWQATGRLPYALVMLLAGLVLMVTIRGLWTGVLLIRNGVAHGRRGWRGRKVDFEVNREGVNRDPHWPSAVNAWRDLESLRVDRAGILLRFHGRRTVGASVFAENFWAFAVWVSRAWEARRP